MIRLSPRQLGLLAACVTGGEDNAPEFEYRTHAELSAFFEFVGIDAADESAGSRPGRAMSFVSAANQGLEAGPSDLPAGLERVIMALLDRREFDSADAQRAAVDRVAGLLEGTPVEVEIDADSRIHVRSTQRGRGQNILDAQIHTAFETTISEADLAAARLHYSKAKRFLSGSTPDYENAAKEAVSSVEALATAMTGERDLPAAIRKATAAGLLPRPLDELIIKLYAYRGNEPGVSHGQAEVPEVTREDAEFVFNLAGSIGAYLRQKLERD